MMPRDLLVVAVLLGQLVSWLSIRDRLAALSAEFREFKAGTNRRLGRLEPPIALRDRS